MLLRHLLLGCLPVLAGCAGGTAPTERPADGPAVQRVDREPNEPLILPHSGSVVGLAFTPDGSALVSSDHTAIRLWDVASWREMATLKNGDSGAKSVAVSPDGKRIAAGNWDTTVRLWDRASGAEVATLAGHAGPVLTVAFSPDGSLLASGGRGAEWGTSAQVKLWDLRTRTAVVSLPGIADPVGDLAFSPDGTTVAVGDISGRVFLWDIASKKVAPPFGGHASVSCVVWSPDGKRLVSGGNDIRVWEPATGKLLATLPVGDDTDDCFGLAITKDGERLASGSHRGNVTVWNLATGAVALTVRKAPPKTPPVVKPIQELSKEFENDIYCIALSPDDSLLAAGVGPTVRVWNLKALLTTNPTAPGR